MGGLGTPRVLSPVRPGGGVPADPTLHTPAQQQGRGTVHLTSRRRRQGHACWAPPQHGRGTQSSPHDNHVKWGPGAARGQAVPRGVLESGCPGMPAATVMDKALLENP